MSTTDFWLQKEKRLERETVLVKIVEWAHRFKRPVQCLSKSEIKEAIKHKTR